MDILRRRYENVQTVESFQLCGRRSESTAITNNMQKSFRRFCAWKTRQLKSMNMKPKDTCIQNMYMPAHGQAKFISLVHMKMNKVNRWFHKICQMFDLEKQMQLKEMRSRPHNIRVCLRCNVYRTVNKEKATAACESCGSCCSFASHIFEIREDKYGTIDTDIRSNNKTDYIDQYECNFASINLQVLDSFRDAYSRFIHVRDVGKVTSTRTKQFIKRLKLPKYLNNCLERLNRELRGDPVPEFKASDIQLIIDQQDDLKRMSINMLNEKEQLDELFPDKMHEQEDNPEDDEPMVTMTHDTSNMKKTQHVQVTTRALALSNGFTQAKLLTLLKNNDVHFGNTRKIVNDFQLQQSQPHQRSNYRGNRVPQWEYVD